MRAPRPLLGDNEGIEIRAALVDALYKDYRSLFIGSVAAFATALVTAWKTSDFVLYLCSMAIALVAVARGFDFRAYSLTRIATGDATRWERRYVVGAASHVAALGLWCLMTFIRSSDPSVHLLSFSLTLAYLIGVSGRNFASRSLVISQIVCAGVPMTAAIVVAGPSYYVIIALVLLPLFVALKLISERLRSGLLEAITYGRKASRLAEQLDGTLQNMAQGVCMFDDAQRVVVCNDRYAELYGLRRDQVKPGTTLRQIVEHRIARGLYAGATPDEYMQERLGPVETASRTIHEMSDGRAIAISRRPLSEGGWVTTHEDVTEQRRYEARIAHMAHHDALTGLTNRTGLSEKLQDALSRAEVGQVVALHLLDLDLFKNVNDSLGHQAGDRLLQMVADRVRSLVREKDTIARMGGDEFAVLQVSVSQTDEAEALGNRIIELMSQPYNIDGHHVIVGTSVGIAMASSAVMTPDQLVRNADMALYRAKGDGRGNLRFFHPEMDAEMQDRRALEDDLRNALTNNELELHYQPIVGTNDNEICCVEALIRWRHPDRGLLAPASFVGLAEEIGLTIRIGEWALKEACQRAARWPEHLAVAVNLSPRQFVDAGLVQTVLDTLAETGLATHRLEVEITESSLLQDSGTTLATLYQLRELGICIALDDFGTGYSSLSYLQCFPFDRIKIDRSFIKDIAHGIGSLSIVRAVIGLAKNLGIKTTAEGVEIQAQVAVLHSEGCTEMQGFFFSKPLPGQEIDQLLSSNCSAGDLPRVA